MDDDTKVALAILAGHAVSLLVFDVWLIARGRKPISAAIREHAVARRLVAAVARHATESIEGDPITAVASVLGRRRRVVLVEEP